MAPFRPIGEIVHRPGYYRFHVGGGHLLWPGLVSIAYFFVMEGFAGATLGKFVVGIRVVKEDGSKLDWSSAFIRNIARFVDAFPYFLPYLVGAISVWTSTQTRQRLGDRWAHSVVVTKPSLTHREPVGYGTGVSGTWNPTPAPPPQDAPSPGAGT